jgi:hypothetical protein
MTTPTVEEKTIAYLPTGLWFSAKGDTKPPLFCKTWLVPTTIMPTNESLKQAIFDRSQRHEGHIVWCGSWSTGKRHATPILYFRDNKLYIPARALLADYLDVPYRSIPFPIHAICDAGKACVEPTHQAPYVNRPTYFQAMQPNAPTRDSILSDIFPDKPHEIPPSDPIKDLFDIIDEPTKEPKR